MKEAEALFSFHYPVSFPIYLELSKICFDIKTNIIYHVLDFLDVYSYSLFIYRILEAAFL